MSKTDLNHMDVAIMNELEKYSDLASDELKEIVKKTATSVKKEIQDNAPVHTGKYKKSWSVKNIQETSHSITCVVYSRNRYQIAHLLENGHASRNGGRVAAKPHIGKAQKHGEEMMAQLIRQKLGGGL